jgi:DNA topoisomerase-1
MADALGDSTRVDIDARSARSGDGYLFRVTGMVQTFPGFCLLYQESTDTPDQEQQERSLPPLEKGDALRCHGLDPKQHFTKPPPRFSEASLVRGLEEKGIGRPSTYATIVSTIQRRGYVKRDRAVLRPLTVGPVVNDLLTKHFARVLDLGFTARMEEELDDIARGERDWQDVLRTFYDPFSRELAEAEERIPRRGIEVGESCEICDRPMILKKSKYGKDFLSCSGFPECRHARPLPTTGSGVTCPSCGQGELMERHATKGKRRSTFYGCNRYPECDYTTNTRPLPEPCPDCGSMLVQSGRSRAKCTACDFQGPVPEKEPEAELVEA